MSNQYSPDQKAAVIAALLAGQSVNSVAREYMLPKSTVSRWKNEPTVPNDGTQKKAVGELVLDYLRANLAALRTQTVMFSNMDWLAKQNAADIAVLHGVMTDKAIRLLEAMPKQEEVDDRE
jgi:transposase-like protein